MRKTFLFVAILMITLFIINLSGAQMTTRADNDTKTVIVKTNNMRSTVWDFETGSQGWTHTNGQAFPAGWAVKESGLHATYTPPDAGDSTMWIDSDAAGNGVTVQDTVLSPVVATSPTLTLLKYGVGFNGGGGSYTNDLYVGIKTFSGGVWNAPVELKHYANGTTFTGWDSVDVSSYNTSDSIQVYFYFDDGATWGYYASFDNVTLVEVLSHDVGISSISSPPNGGAAPGNYAVIATIHNFGQSAETFNVTAEVFDTTDSWNLIFTQTINLTNLAVSADTTHDFGTVAFADPHVYFTKVYTDLSDGYPSNDTLSHYTNCTGRFWEIGTDMPYTASGPYAGYSTVEGNINLHVFGGNPGPQSDHYIFDGTSWTTGKNLPLASNYGGYCSVNNKIYMIGGRTDGPDSFITIYDAVLDTFTTRYLPGTIGDPAIAVKDNNYIYIIGGCRPTGWTATTIVMLYDIAGDSFFTDVTQLPTGDARICATAGYIGNDTIIVAGGIDNSNANTNITLLGAIDPVNPANITWTHGIDKPGTAVYRLGGDVWRGKFYITGGAGSAYYAETYVYESNVGWTTLPDKPTACSNLGCVMVPIPTTKGIEGLLTASGGYTGSYLSAFEIYHTGDVTTGIKNINNSKPDKFAVKLLTPAITSNGIKISFTLPNESSVKFNIVNTAGRTIVMDKYSKISGGSHILSWNGKDSNGRRVPSGTYFYRIRTKNNTATGKIVIIR